MYRQNLSSESGDSATSPAILTLASFPLHFPKCQDTEAKSYSALYSFGLASQVTNRALPAAWETHQRSQTTTEPQVLIPHRARADPESSSLSLYLSPARKTKDSSRFPKASTTSLLLCSCSGHGCPFLIGQQVLISCHVLTMTPGVWETVLVSGEHSTVMET